MVVQDAIGHPSGFDVEATLQGLGSGISLISPSFMIFLIDWRSSLCVKSLLIDFILSGFDFRFFFPIQGFINFDYESAVEDDILPIIRKGEVGR